MMKRYDVPEEFTRGGKGLQGDSGDSPSLKEFIQTLLDSVGGEYTCASGVAVGDAVFVSTTDTVALADANDTGKVPAIGVVVYKKTSGATKCKVAFIGEVDCYSGLTAGATYYLSNTAGGKTATAPTPNAQPIGIAKNETTLVLLPSGVGLAAIYTHLTSTYGFIDLSPNQFTLLTGAPLAVFADGSSAVPGLEWTASKAQTIRWNNNATLNGVLTSFLVPPDMDITADASVAIQAAKVGATAGDLPTFAVGAYNSVVGAAYDADSNLGGTTGAMTNATTKTIQSVSVTLALADLAAYPARVSMSVKPTDGTLGTDDLVMLGARVNYKKKLLAS